MNLRKFYFITSLIISVFLFLSGVAILSYLSISGEFGQNDGTGILDHFKFSKQPVNILVLGGDRVNKNTDTMMLINYNPATAKINLLSIPRDTKVPVKGSSLPKINSAYPAGGATRAVETVSNLFNINIKYYVYVDISSFAKIIDILGGVDYYVPADMDYDDPIQKLHIHLKKGQQRLNGDKAVQFMRFRQPNHYNKQIRQYYDGSDLKRIDAQQDFIKEIVKQKMSVYNILRLNEIINVVFKNIETNITLDEALNMSQSLTKLRMDKIDMFKVEGNDALEGGVWYYVIDRNKNDEIISQYFNAKEGYDKDSKINKPKASSPTSKPKSNNNSSSKPANGSFTKNNPSNNGSSIKGSQTPMP